MAPSHTDSPRANVLIVDDVPENLRYLTVALNREGFKARPAQSGRLALEAARLQHPDLVLLDINMPDMNGYDVCTAFKADPTLVRIPIIFVSAVDGTLDKVRAFETGGVDYVVKPFQVEEVVARVRTHVRLYQLQRERERLVQQLQASLETVKQLEGFIPICASCKNVRDDDGYWARVESYISSRTGARFTHGVCPTCEQKLYAEMLGNESASTK